MLYAYICQCIQIFEEFLYCLCIDLCGTLKSTEIAIHIVALVLSIMITLISTIILAVVVIVCPCKENQEVAGQDKKVMLCTYNT